MNGPKLHVGISHAAHLPDRRTALASLLKQLGDVPVNVTSERAPCWRWSELMWTRAAVDEATSHAVFVQDDALVSPRFVDRLRALVEAHPAEAIALFSPFPDADAMARDGVRAVRAHCAWGAAYVVPRRMLVQFLEWRARLPVQRMRSCGEDSLLSAFLRARGMRWLYPVPGLVDRRPEDELPSTSVSMARSPFAQAAARWDEARPELETAEGWRGTIVEREVPWDVTPVVLATLGARPAPRVVCVRGAYELDAVPVSGDGPIEVETDRAAVSLQGTVLQSIDPWETGWRSTEYPGKCAAWLAVEGAIRGGARHIWLEDEHGPTTERPEIVWAGQ